MEAPDLPTASGGGERRLTPRELLVLQLLAQGHDLRQIAWLTGTDEAAVSAALTGAVWALGATSVEDAITIRLPARL